MKNFAVTILTLIFLGGAFGLLHAEENQAPWTPKDEAKFINRLERRSRRRIKALIWQLKITPEEKTALEGILHEKDEKALAIEKDYREKKASLRAETKEKIMAVFTPEQKDLYENGEGQKGGSSLHDQSPGRYKGGGLHED